MVGLKGGTMNFYGRGTMYGKGGGSVKTEIQ